MTGFYRYLDEIATADVAFEAWGDTLEEMFVAAAEATMNVMVGDLGTIAHREQRLLAAESDAVDMLLFELLQDLIFYKDAEQLLLRVPQVHIRSLEDGRLALSAEAYGERLNPTKHDLVADVKAVTLHRFQVEEVRGETQDASARSGWRCTAILDV